MWLHRTYSSCSPASPTDASLPGWWPVSSILGWLSAMYATAVFDSSGVVLFDGCRISLGCYRLPPTVLVTLRQELLWAYKAEADMLE